MSQTVTNQVFFSNQSTAAQTGLDEQSNKTSAFYTYDGYGRMTSLGKIPDNQRIDFLWNQLLLEQVSGLTYMQHRFYHSFFKRFISRDKLNVENCYTYAHGNPVTLIDPSGLNAQQVMNYGLGTGFSILGVLGAIFAFPTGGASLLTLSAAAGIGAGISTALSGLSLMGSQAALDSGNKAAAKALQYTSMGLGVLATVEGVVAIAPSVADFFGYQSRYLTRYLGFWHTPRVVVDKWINMFSILEEQPNFFPDNMTDWTIKEITEITGTSTDIEKEEEIANFLKKVRDWHKSWQISRSSAAGYDVVNKEVYRYAPVKERLASQSFGRSPSTVRGLGRSEFPPRISTSTKFSKYVKNHIADITEKLGGDASLAKEWYRSGRYKGQITSILEE
ncbi:MAG: hypothetical protein OXE99_09530 [Cellvibrionales bacterium]|nr:hypothetical protein [Cellvibrionales bacterium]